MTKYHNRRTELDGIVFDSRREANRYAELKLMERARLIRDLRLQVPFELIPASRRNGKAIRAVHYVADFVYFDANDNLVVEDAKGMKTEVYKLKKKLMIWKYGIEIKEV